MSTFQTSPGMRDLIGADAARLRAFTAIFGEVAEAAGFGPVSTPLLEDAAVFNRVGEATDIVQKEMYRFTDNGGRDVALRPEFTAAVCRSFVQHRPPTPWKVWLSGSNFRYERPQRGRYRQFDQVDAETIGSDDPQVDVEMIALGWRFLERLGLRQVTLLLNSLGTTDERRDYTAALDAYFRSHAAELSEQSRVTLERNPLRVLDSKRPGDAELIAAAPTIDQFYGADSAAHFAAVRAGLDRLDIAYEISPRLVRGLDYYVATTFEFAGGTLDSAQNALGGGGRYDGLIAALGGPPTPAIGFAIGVDRALLACDDEGVFAAPAAAPAVFVVDTTGGAEATALCDELRRIGVAADRAFDGRSMKAQMKAAGRSGAELALIVGDDELAAGTVTVRPLAGDGDQHTVERSAVVAAVTAALAG